MRKKIIKLMGYLTIVLLSFVLLEGCGEKKMIEEPLTPEEEATKEEALGKLDEMRKD